jgi:hypothetical protein
MSIVCLGPSTLGLIYLNLEGKPEKGHHLYHLALGGPGGGGGIFL